MDTVTKDGCHNCEHLFNQPHCVRTGCLSSPQGVNPGWQVLQAQAMNGRDTTKPVRQVTDMSAGRLDHATGVMTPWPEIKPASSALDVQVGGSHYKDMAIQPIEYILTNKMPFPEGCVVKYVSRWRSKGGVQDLKKARHFLDVLIEAEEKAA